MKRGRTGVALAMAGLLVGSIWLGVAVTGNAATTQQVKAAIVCQPTTAAPERTVGCTLTVTNEGGNNVNKVMVTVSAPGGTFQTSSSSKCDPDGSTLTCDIGKLTGFGTPGHFFAETHELLLPASAELDQFVQTVTGRYSSATGNNRGSDEIPEVEHETTLDPSADFDATFANADGDFVDTDSGLSASNPYSTSATVNGSAFEVGLTVHEHTPGPQEEEENCPSSGCLGDQVLEFTIAPLVDDVPDTYTLVITIAGEVVGNTKIEDLVVRHDGAVVGLCTEVPLSDPAGACITDRFKENSTKIATFTITGPGSGNGSWGVG